MFFNHSFKSNKHGKFYSSYLYLLALNLHLNQRVLDHDVQNYVNRICSIGEGETKNVENDFDYGYDF